MRILMLSYEFPPLGGGGSRVVHGLSKGLMRSGHEIDVVTMGYHGLKRQETVNGVNVYRVPCIRMSKSICRPPEMASYILTSIPLILKLLKRNKYDINHTHFVFPDGVLSWIVKKRTGLPYVLTAHGSDIPGYNPNRFKLAHRFLSPLWRKVVQEADHVVFPSQALQKLYFAKGGHDRTSVIPNGISTDKYKVSTPKQKRILVVTRMFERKGVQYFLRAIDGMSIDHEINIVGDGPYLPELQNMAKERNLSVRFLGWLENPSPQLNELFETSEIFIFTSGVENFPIVLLEAMASGAAIITTKRTGCQEVVGDTGLLVKPKSPESIREALQKLIDQPELCERMGRAARQRLDKYFSWTTVTKQYCDLYGHHIRPADRR